MQRPNLRTGSLPLRNELSVRNVKLLLKELAQLKQSSYSHISFVANLVLMGENTLRPEMRRSQLNDVISAVLTTGQLPVQYLRHDRTVEGLWCVVLYCVLIIV